MSPERIEVEGKTFIARTLAAATANMSYQYFANLCAAKNGPPVGYIQDGKKFYCPRQIKKWKRARSWTTGKPSGRKRGRMRRFELAIKHEHFDLLKQRHGNVSKHIRSLIEKDLT